MLDPFLSGSETEGVTLITREEDALAVAPPALAEAKRKSDRIQTFLEAHVKESAVQTETVL